MLDIAAEIPALISGLLVKDDSGEQWFDFGRNPTATEVIARAVADHVRDHRIDAVVSWRRPEESVLAHIVARELGAVRTEVELDLGLLSLESELSPGSRVLLLATFWAGRRPLVPLNTFLKGRGHSVIVAASLVPAEPHILNESDLPQITLAS